MFIKPELLATLIEAFNEDKENFPFLDFNVEFVGFGLHDVFEIEFGHFNVKIDDQNGEVLGIDTVFVGNTKTFPEIMADIQKFVDIATQETEQ